MEIKYKVTFQSIQDRKQWVKEFRQFLKSYSDWKPSTTIRVNKCIVYICLTKAYCCVTNKIESFWWPRYSNLNNCFNNYKIVQKYN